MSCLLVSYASCYFIWAFDDFSSPIPLWSNDAYIQAGNETCHKLTYEWYGWRKRDRERRIEANVKFNTELHACSSAMWRQKRNFLALITTAASAPTESSSHMSVGSVTRWWWLFNSPRWKLTCTRTWSHSIGFWNVPNPEFDAAAVRVNWIVSEVK